MSVMMGLRVSVDPSRFEEVLRDNEGKFLEVAERGKRHGAIHHRFFANEAGDAVLVVDEWPDAESFERFFSSSPEIGELMQQAGVTSEPRVDFWRELDTVDKF